MIKEKRKRKRRKRILTAVLLFLLLGGAVAALHFLFIEEVSVKGTCYTDRQKIYETAFPEETDLRLISVLKKTVLQEPETSVFTSKITFLSLKSIQITVTESAAYVRVPYEEGYLILTKEGNVLGKTSGEEKGQALRKISGLEILSYQDFSLPETAVPESLSSALILSDALDRYGFTDEILRWDGGGFYLSPGEGEILVSLGKATNLDQKLTELKNQLPVLSGLHGVLHLEVLDEGEEAGQFYFSVE